MGLFGAAKADPKKQVNEMSQLLRDVVEDFPLSNKGPSKSSIKILLF